MFFVFFYFKQRKAIRTQTKIDILIRKAVAAKCSALIQNGKLIK